jgi:hypothetical protein
MEIQGYPNYLIYEDGRVYSKYCNKFMKPWINHENYYNIELTNEKGKKTFKHHRLIAIHFIPNPENKPQVDHKNRITKDNRIENLRWATQCENQQNKGIQKNNTSGIKNISFNKNGLYVYNKMINKTKFCKYFKTLEEAIEFKKEYELLES